MKTENGLAAPGRRRQAGGPATILKFRCPYGEDHAELCRLMALLPPLAREQFISMAGSLVEMFARDRRRPRLPGPEAPPFGLGSGA
jgi:hypothetical protein